MGYFNRPPLYLDPKEPEEWITAQELAYKWDLTPEEIEYSRRDGNPTIKGIRRRCERYGDHGAPRFEKQGGCRWRAASTSTNLAQGWQYLENVAL